MSRPPGDSTPLEPAAPAADFAEVWEALDALPRAASSIDMAATTIDMVAMSVDGGTGPRSSAVIRGPGLRRWLLPAAAVAASLVAGLVAGRIATPDPDVRVLEYLPLIRHFHILEEAGSVTFLKAVANRKLPPPFWLPGGDLRGAMREFDDALGDLETDHAWGAAAAERVSDRREEIRALSGTRRDEIERDVAAFHALSSAQRRDLAAVATALADPKRQELRDAARTWHLWVAASDPPDRRNIVELDAEGRIEWLDRRPRLRERDRGGDRRGPNGADGPPPRGPDGRPRWPGGGPGPGQGPGGPPGGPGGPGPGPRGGPPRPREPRPDEPRGDRPPTISPASPPPETRGPPG